VEFLFVGVPIERPSILLGDQSVSITERHYPAWVRARQEKWEAQVRRTWQANEPQQEIHSGHKENDARYKTASIATSSPSFLGPGLLQLRRFVKINTVKSIE